MIKNILIFMSSLNLLISQPLAGSETQAKESKKAVEISQTEMERLLKVNPQIRTRRLALTEFEELKKKEEQERKKRRQEKLRKQKEKEEQERKERQTTMAQTAQDVAPLHQINLGGDAGDAALVVFAVIGLVVIIAWIPYAAMGIKELITGQKSSNLDFLLSINTSLIEKKRIRSQTNTIRSGSDLNLNLSFYFKESESSQYGLSTEVGYHLFEDQLQSGTIQHNAVYALTGPSLRVFFDNKKTLGLKMDLMAGTSEDNSIGLLSKAQILLQVYQNDLLLHFGGGSQFIESQRTEGPLLNLNSFNFYAVAGVGFNF
jgi:hypothetical protein